MFPNVLNSSELGASSLVYFGHGAINEELYSKEELIATDIFYIYQSHLRNSVLFE